MNDLQSDSQPAVEQHSTPATPGQILADLRKQRGLSVTDVAQQLKLGLKQIKALEADDYASLPGNTFIRGFIRNYAKLVETEAAPLIAYFEQHGPSLQTNAILPPNEAISFPDQEAAYGRKRLYAIVILVFLVTGITFDYVWHDGHSSLTSGFRTKKQPVPSAPAVASAPIVFAAGEEKKSSEILVKPTEAKIVTPEPIKTPLTTDVKLTPAQNLDQAPIQQATQPLGRRRRIVLNFDAEAWVEIKNRNDKILFSRISPAGSEQMIEAIPPLYLTVGNASSVRVTYNDRLVELNPHKKTDVARITLK